jgi:hypothetical protein
MPQSYFRAALLFTFLLTLFSGISAVLVVRLSHEPLRPAEQQLFVTLLTVFVAGAGGIFRLLSRKRGR